MARALDAPGLYYCRARMYLPVHGRWLQPDPAGFAAGDMNLYRCCGNDPVNGCDPSGLDQEGDQPQYIDTGEGGGTNDDGTADSEDPRDADSILSQGDAPIGSHIPSITYTSSNDKGFVVLSGNALSGYNVVWQSSPSVTTVGGLSAVGPKGGDGYATGKMVVLGTGQGYPNALHAADSKGALALYNTNSNWFYDFAMDIYQKLFGGYNNQSAIDEAAYASGFSSPPAVEAYSEGALDTVEAIYDYGMKASSLTFDAAPVSLPGLMNATAQAGATSAVYHTNFGDAINVVAPSFNPITFASGLSLPTSIYIHISTYPGF